MTNPGPVIQFDNVGLRYGSGDEVLRDVSFALDPGTFYFLTGKSGAGKSSLLKLMYLHHRASRGLINLFSKDVATASRDELPALRRHIGVVFQEFRLLDHLTAYENIALPLKIAGDVEADYRDNVIELMEWVGLKDRIKARPPTLSGGEQQRVAIARAVVNRPRLLLADEPTGNVDPDMARRLLRLFEELNRTGTTIVIATHDYGLVSETGHPALHIEQGEVTLLPPGTLPAPATGRKETT